jgi:hypothetical protein
MPRSKAAALLQERIDAAAEIGSNNQIPDIELRSAEAKEKQWRDYNRLLLCKLFTTAQFADEYDQVVRKTHLVQDRYFEVDDAQIRGRLIQNVLAQIGCLSSIKNRLPLIEEPEDIAPGSEAAAPRPEDEAGNAPVENV